jgi:hypothetical protein
MILLSQAGEFLPDWDRLEAGPKKIADLAD